MEFESVSGFTVRGSRVDVVEHGERITRALKDLGRAGETVDEDALEAWDDWRPKADERLSEDVNDTTAEQASISAGEGGRAGTPPVGTTTGTRQHRSGPQRAELREESFRAQREGAVQRDRADEGQPDGELQVARGDVGDARQFGEQPGGSENAGGEEVRQQFGRGDDEFAHE